MAKINNGDTGSTARSKINALIALPQVTVSADKTLDASDMQTRQRVTTGESDVTITLPSAATYSGEAVWIEKVDSGGGKVIVGSELVSLVLQGDRVCVQSNGTSWDVLLRSMLMATSRLLGRTSSGSGVAEEISVSAPLTLTGGALGFAVNYQEFTASGTWSKPSGLTHYYAEAVGGGGGGGSGRRDASGTNRGGGSGGAGGTFVSRFGRLSDLGSTESVTIGAGGAGGAAVTVDATNGNAGTQGGDTTFGSALYAPGGTNGIGGTNGATIAGGAIRFRGNATFGAGYAGAGGNSSATAGSVAGSIGAYGPGGGGGGGRVEGTTAGGGAAGGQGFGALKSATSATTGGGGAGGSAGTTIGDGGGGGSGSNTAAATNGGDGITGGGGGGGGATVNGFNSGAGGAGGNGFVRVWCW